LIRYTGATVVVRIGLLSYAVGVLIILHAVSIDITVWQLLPGFAFFHQHVFLRNDINLPGVTWQLTTEWAVPFQIGGVRFVQDGFAHFIGPEGGTHFNIIAQPQLLLDIGKFAHYVDQVFLGAVPLVEPARHIRLRVQAEPSQGEGQDREAGQAVRRTGVSLS